MDKGLRYILDTITYIKWPGTDNSKEESQFWERLRLSMPKKRVTCPPGKSFPGPLNFIFREPPSSLDSSPFSTLPSRRSSNMFSKEPSVSSVVSAVLLVSQSNLTSDMIYSADIQVKPTGNVSHADFENGDIVSMQRTDISPIVCNAEALISHTQEPNGNGGGKADGSAYLSGSSTQLLGFTGKASAAETFTLNTGKAIASVNVTLPNIVDGNSSSPVEITCCSFV